MLHTPVQVKEGFCGFVKASELVQPAREPSDQYSSAVGDLGDCGDRGAVGDRGDCGDRGAVGDLGDCGDRGAVGDLGDCGDRGAVGDLGDCGDRGAVGDLGDCGDRGAVGDLGDCGDRGAVGDRGDCGDRGAVGDLGDCGDRGAVGDLGDCGDRGAVGDLGDQYSSAAISTAPSTSFVLASQLLPAPITTTQHRVDSVSDDLTPDTPKFNGENKHRLMENLPSCSLTDSHSHLSASDVGAGRLKRVKVDPNDLYEDYPTSSEATSPSPGPSVSGPGLTGFFRASNLAVASPSLTSRSTAAASGREGDCGGVVSSVRPSVCVTERERGTKGHTKPLPKITNFFNKYGKT